MNFSNNLTTEEQDFLIEFVWGEQEADRNWHSEITEVVTTKDALVWLIDNKYDWHKMLKEEFVN
tara:strand:- start:326 stop:517 length:192 start_codon:yes stop_codon:yes gene_type:complete